MRRQIHTEMILDRITDPRLGVNRAREMVMQVRALWHFQEQRAQRERIGFRDVQVAICKPLASGRFGHRLMAGRLCPQRSAARRRDDENGRGSAQELSVGRNHAYSFANKLSPSLVSPVYREEHIREKPLYDIPRKCLRLPFSIIFASHATLANCQTPRIPWK